jgi:hypothetical protein
MSYDLANAYHAQDDVFHAEYSAWLDDLDLYNFLLGNDCAMAYLWLLIAADSYAIDCDSDWMVF